MNIEDHTQVQRDAGMALSRLHPGSQHSDLLGHRPIDEGHGWVDVDSSGYTLEEFSNFNSNYRAAPTALRHQQPTIAYQDLSPQQKEVVDLCQEQIRNQTHPIKRVLVQGKAGTGKSAVIKHLCHIIESEFGPRSYQVLAPTGAAALNLDGATIHSYLSLPIQGELSPLN